MLLKILFMVKPAAYFVPLFMVQYVKGSLSDKKGSFQLVPRVAEMFIFMDSTAQQQHELH